MEVLASSEANAEASSEDSAANPVVQVKLASTSRPHARILWIRIFQIFSVLFNVFSFVKFVQFLQKIRIV